MPITRKLSEISVGFLPDGSPVVRVSGVITDTDENTVTGRSQTMQAATVVAEAVLLRDAVLAVAAAAGKPLTL